MLILWYPAGNPRLLADRIQASQLRSLRLPGLGGRCGLGPVRAVRTSDSHHSVGDVPFTERIYLQGGKTFSHRGSGQLLA